MVAVGNHVWWFFWGDEWFFVGNASEKTWEWIVLMGFFWWINSDYQKLNFWWLLTVNCWIFGLPISPFKKAAAKEYAGCAFAEQGSSTDPSKLWNPLIVLLTDKKIRALPCLSQQVPPTGCDCIVHGPHGLGFLQNQCEFLVLEEAPSNKNKTWSMWIVVSWGFDLHPVVWLVNPQQCTSRI